MSKPVKDIATMLPIAEPVFRNPAPVLAKCLGSKSISRAKKSAAPN